MTGRGGWMRRIGECAFLLVAGAMLLVPLLGTVLDRSGQQSDNRALAPAPALPADLAGLVAWPRQADAYLGDHFGLRAQMVRADGYIHWTLLDSSPVSKIVIGRNGRIFLSDGSVPYQVLLGECGAWWPEDQVASLARDIEASLRLLAQRAPGMPILIVPTSTILYPQDLPAWIARACAGRVPLADDILRRLPADLRQGIYYLPAEAAALPASAPLIPKHNFHWTGNGVGLFMEQFAERDLHLRRQVTPTLSDATEPADLSIFVPGVALSNRIQITNWPPGLDYCPRPACLNRPPLDGIALSSDMARWQRPGAGGRLLLLGNSFGSAAASTLIEYFSDIIFISMNPFQGLPPNQRRVMWDRVTTGWRPDRGLMVIHDGDITQLPRFIGLLPDKATE